MSSSAKRPPGDTKRQPRNRQNEEEHVTTHRQEMNQKTAKDMRDIGLENTVNYQGGNYEHYGHMQKDEENTRQSRFMSGGSHHEGPRGRRAPKFKP